MNLSSSEDEEYSSNDEDISEILKKQRQQKQQKQRGRRESKTDFVASESASTTEFPRSNESEHELSIRKNGDNGNDNDAGDDSDDSDDFSNIDWEDASVEDENVIDEEKMNNTNMGNDFLPRRKKVRSYPSRDVVIHFGGINGDNGSAGLRKDNDSSAPSQSQCSNGSRKKPKRKRMRKIKNLTSNARTFLEELQKVHILSSIGRSIFHSSLLGSTDEEIWSTAYSLIPLEMLEAVCSSNARRSISDQGHAVKRVPTYTQLQKFSMWFFDLVNNVDEKRWRIHISNVAAGAPRTRMNSRRRGGSKGSGSGTHTATTSPNSSIPQNGSSEIDKGCGIEGIDQLSISSEIKKRLSRLCSYFSPTNDDHPEHSDERILISSLEKVLLFVCMTRSLGWRVRFVKSLIPMDKELTADHPLFATTMRNTFQSIVKSIDVNAGPSLKRKKRKRRETNEQGSKDAKGSTGVGVNGRPIPLAADTLDDFVWVEVLCNKNVTRTSSSTRAPTHTPPSSKQHYRWVHIDPHHELFDKPSLVECIDILSSTPSSNKKTSIRKKICRPVSYVMAVEHTHDVTEHMDNCANSCPDVDPVLLTSRLTDITPRYANKWSLTLKLRGATAKDLSNGGGKCPNAWWSRTMKKVNRYFTHQRRICGLSGICKDDRNKGISDRIEKKNSSSPFKIEKGSSGEDIVILDDSDDDNDEEKERNGLTVASEDVDEDSEDMEKQEFASMKEREAIPTSKAAFKNHPLYVIPSVLKNQEVLAPDARKRMCGMFKGELVYKRVDVSTALTAKKWPYKGRKVKEGELSKPAKLIKARKKPVKKGFQALTSYGTTTEDQAKSFTAGDDYDNDGKSRLYGVWQTQKWSPPPVGPNDPIPVNEHNNVELELLNPGLVHLELRRIALVAKRLGVPYAPCLLGFEGHGGNRTPTIRGIVVHECNVELLQEAHLEWESQAVENEYKERQRAIYGRWKKLIFGMMTKERLEREYANA